MMDDDYVSLKQVPPLHSGDSGDEPDVDSSENEEDIVFERDTRSDDSASFDLMVLFYLVVGASLLSQFCFFGVDKHARLIFRKGISRILGERPNLGMYEETSPDHKTGYTELGLDQMLLSLVI
jgi:hypothetical protein